MFNKVLIKLVIACVFVSVPCFTNNLDDVHPNSNGGISSFENRLEQVATSPASFAKKAFLGAVIIPATIIAGVCLVDLGRLAFDVCPRLAGSATFVITALVTSYIHGCYGKKDVLQERIDADKKLMEENPTAMITEYYEDENGIKNYNSYALYGSNSINEV